MTEIQTPSRIGDDGSTPSNSKLDMETTCMDTSHVNGQLDVIAANVNRTIQDLNQIYREIGYSATEISIKKSEIFTVLEETINNFTSNLQREKNNIENECEWLRQQIRIILAIINDSNGDKSLTEMNKGLVFKDFSLFEQGFKSEIRKKLTVFQTSREHFYEDSPFNISAPNALEEPSFEKGYEQMLAQTPHLSLVNLKHRLNNIFLDILKHFVKHFKKLNSLGLHYLDLLETLGDVDNEFEKVLPPKEDSLFHQQLIDQFESTIKALRLSDVKFTSSSFLSDLEGNGDTNGNNMSFITSSPTKSKIPPTNPQDNETIQSHSPNSVDDLMNNLRDINYQLVKVIRGLKFTKISSKFLTDLSKLIDFFQLELENRQQKINSVIHECFELIGTLGYDDELLISLQKQFNSNNSNSKVNNSSSEGYFDKETLKFIQLNPKEFGLNQVHLKFIENFLNLLTKVKVSKQRKLDYYLSNCHSLWEKLNENQEYVDNFISINNNLHDNSLTNFKMELNRLFSKRSEYIDTFIIETRKEIERLWDSMFYTHDQRSTFKYYDYKLDSMDYDESFDKEMILNEHEQELASLKQEFSLKEPILLKFDQLKQLIKDQEFLNESSKDSSRLLSKNSCKILLNEERLRKKILKNMPKLINELKQSVIEYNNVQLNDDKKPFMMHKDDFFEKLLVIENQQLNKKPAVTSKSTSTVTTTSTTSPKKPRSLHSASTLPNKTAPKSTRTLKRQSPIIANPIRKPVRLNRNNHSNLGQKSRDFRHNSNDRMKNVINSSVNESNESPYSVSAQRVNSSLMKPVNQTHLQPLNSPLMPTTKDTNITRTSNYFSPNKFDTNNDTTMITNDLNDDKENEDVTFHDIKLGLTPIKVSDLSKWDKRDTSTPTTERANFDSSTIDGEEYRQWRTDRLNQINSVDDVI